MTSRTSPAARRAASFKATPSRPKIVAGYLRLTVDRDGDKIGYEGQRSAIQAWADANGYKVVWFQDKGITAAKNGVIRPGYEEMMARLAAGEFAGIVVWRLDRLVRLTREFERCYGMVEDAKAFIVDTQQGIDTRKDVGKMMMRLLVMMAEMEISAMRARAREHQLVKAKSGKVSAGGHRPFGFIGFERDPKTEAITNKGSAMIEHHPVEAALLREAADRIAYKGATYADIAREWAERDPPILGTSGGPMEPENLRRILISPRIAGLREYDVRDDEGEFIETAYSKAEWKAIIERDTWQVLRSPHRPYQPRTTDNEHLLTGGLAKCGACGKPLVAGSRKAYSGEYVPIYRCHTSIKARQNGSCGIPQAGAREVEMVVLEKLFARLEESPELHDLVHASVDNDEAAAKRENSLREIGLCDENLEDLGRRTTLEADDPEYLTEAQERGRAKGWLLRRSRAEKVLDEVRMASGRPSPNDEDRQDLRGWFGSLSLGEKRSWLWAHLAEVRVLPRRTRSTRSFDPGRVVTLFADPKDRRGSSE